MGTGREAGSRGGAGGSRWNPLSRARLLSGNTITEYPASLVSGEITAQGGNLYFTESGKVGKFSPSAPAAITTTPTSLPVVDGITAGPDNNIWITEQGFSSPTGAIGKLDTTSFTITPYGTAQGLPANARPFGITVGPNNVGTSVIWFTDSPE